MDSLSLDCSCLLSSVVLTQKLDGELVLLHPEQGLYYGLNQVGTTVWELLRQSPGRSLRSVMEALCQEYDVSQAQCEEDVLKMVRQLYNSGLATINLPTR